jgi:hypothetical protein
MRLRGKSSRANNDGFVDITTIGISSSEDDDEDIEDPIEDADRADLRELRRPADAHHGAEPTSAIPFSSRPATRIVKMLAESVEGARRRL